MTQPAPRLLRDYPAFTVLRSDATGTYVSIALKRPRTVSSFDDYGAAAYVAGAVDAPSGKEEMVYAFLTNPEGVRLLPLAPRSLKAAVVEGRFFDYVSQIGFSLHDCTVREERA